MDNFKIYSSALNFDKYIRKNLVYEISKIDRDIRIHLLDESYYMLKNLNKAIYNKGNVRIKYLVDLIVNITMLDYLLGYLKDKNINHNHLLSAINKLTNLKNMIFSWRNTEEIKKNENK